MSKRIIISTDCTCDLPQVFVEKYQIELLYFFVYTPTGNFRDRDEITAMNVFECMKNGEKVISSAPPASDYVGYYSKLLRKGDEVIHITTGANISLSYPNSLEAIKQLGEAGKRIHLFDSMSLSTGMAHMVLKAARMNEENASVEAIMDALAELRARVSASFITKDAEYLLINRRIKPWVARFIKAFSLHPVLCMKDGNISVKRIMRGNHNKAQQRYIRKELKKADRIEDELAFITPAGCTTRQIDNIKKQVNESCRFNELYVTDASATISCNCGPETVGIMFIRKPK